MGVSRRVWIGGVAGLGAIGVGTRWALRRSSREASRVNMAVEGDRRVVASNGMPGHVTGDYPNAHDPVPLRVQSHRFEMPARPVAASAPRPLAMWLFGVAVNGVPFDPSGPFWDRRGDSGWQFEVMCPFNAVALGIDVNHAHTQGRGVYHYHGVPTALLWQARRDAPEVSDQMFKERKFLAGQFHILSAASHTHIIEIHGKLFVLISRRRFLFGSAKNSANTRYHLFYRKRFGDVIVSSDLQSRYFVAFGSLCRQHYYRDRLGQLFPPQPSAKFHAAHPRQHEVKYHERRRLLFVECQSKAFFGRFGNTDAKSLTLEVILQAFGDISIVFDDQDILEHKMVRQRSKKKF